MIHISCISLNIEISPSFTTAVCLKRQPTTITVCNNLNICDKKKINHIMAYQVGLIASSHCNIGGKPWWTELVRIDRNNGTITRIELRCNYCRSVDTVVWFLLDQLWTKTIQGKSKKPKEPKKIKIDELTVKILVFKFPNENIIKLTLRQWNHLVVVNIYNLRLGVKYVIERLTNFVGLKKFIYLSTFNILCIQL